MALNLLITAFDHELYRFLGLRLGPNFLAVYADPTTMADSLFLNVLRGDRGGPFLSPLLCVGAPALYLWWSIRMVRRRTARAASAPLGPAHRSRHPHPAARHRPDRLFARPRQVPPLPARARSVRDRSAISPGATRTTRRRATPARSPAPGRPNGSPAAPTTAGASPNPDYPVRPRAGPARPRRRRRERWNVLIIQLESVRGSRYRPSPP